MEVVLPIISFYVALALIPALVAQSRGRDSAEWFVAGLLLSPIFATIILVMQTNMRDATTDPNLAADQISPVDRADRGPCPRCGESIPLVATMCRFCNLDLIEYDETIGGEGLGDR